MSLPAIFTTAEAAAALKTSEDYVARQCAAGAIRAVKAGGGWRITEAALLAFLAEDAPSTRGERSRQSARQRRRAS
jgi:excisionase family DNA binding protein